MKDLLKLIKANMKEGADIAEIETLLKGLNPLDGIDSTEKAIEFINKTDILNRAKDSIISTAVKSHDDKCTDEKLPRLLKAEREKAIKELNPEETAEQKTIREQKERIDALEAKGNMSALKSSLQAKASELGYSGDVELFLGLGDQAESYLEKEAKRFKTAIDERVRKDIKELYGDTKPKTSEVDPAKAMSRADYESLHPIEQANINLSEVTLVD